MKVDLPAFIGRSRYALVRDAFRYSFLLVHVTYDVWIDLQRLRITESFELV